MSSAYGSMPSSTYPTGILPLKLTLKDNTECEIRPVDATHIPFLHNLLNEIIKDGTTYPQESELTATQFTQYFTTSFVCISTSTNAILGGFYIKPNFPGRCSHICNGGFIVSQQSRGNGVGMAMGKAFLQLAPAMGYKASMFNLVFENNVASVRLWDRLGFKVIGRLPNAGRLANSEKLVDALMYHYEF
ncbi:hypothetical protein HDV02_000715 [Globomyces sp. JEL0801]|nr:hypothetical protein HDV02_000715 [Globomyces sp. JEL0801]